MIEGSHRRVVVTGLGVVSAIGTNRTTFWRSLVEGRSGICPVERFDTSGFERHNGGEIRGFDIRRWFPSNPELVELGRAKQMMLAASKECLEDAQFSAESAPFRAAVVIGTTMGEAQALESVTDALAASKGMTEVPCAAAADYAAESIPQAVARQFELYGPNYMISNACAAGSFSIGQGVLSIQSGEVDAVLAGGADAFSRYAFSGFHRLGAIAPDLPRPFSRDRKGMIPGEGAAAILLEEFQHARARGAHIYAEIVGYGESCDAHHITQPHENGIAQAIEEALHSAALSASRISCISVHGTGTPTNDAVETRALKRVFGELLATIPISAVKSMTGHPMGAASAIECVAALLSIEHQFLTPTTNFESPDPDCDVDCVPNEGRRASVEYVLKTSSAFGGNNAVIVFRRMQHGEQGAKR